MNMHALPTTWTPAAAPAEDDGGGAARRLRSLAERADVVGHALNNMLGAMIGYSALILEDTPADDPNHAFLAQVLLAGDEAKLLVRQLLTAAQAELAAGA